MGSSSFPLTRSPLPLSNQTKIIELLREVHLIAIKEIERLNLRIAELENLVSLPNEAPAKGAIVNPASVPSAAGRPEILNEHQVAEYIGMSVATVRHWRLTRKGPNFMKIGSAVRYRREDVEKWLDSCSGALTVPGDCGLAQRAYQDQPE